MFWVFRHQERKLLGFPVRESTSQVGAFEHSFGGKPGPLVMPEGNKAAKPHLIAKLDLADPKLGIAIPGVRFLPLLFAFKEVGPVRYAPKPGGATSIQSLKRETIEWDNEKDDFDLLVERAATEGFPSCRLEIGPEHPITPKFIRRNVFEYDDWAPHSDEEPVILKGQWTGDPAYYVDPMEGRDPNNPNDLATTLAGTSHWFDSRCVNDGCAQRVMEVIATIECAYEINGVQFYGENGEEEMPCFVFCLCRKCGSIWSTCLAQS